MTFSYINVREISRAFILKVSNKLDLCYNIRDIFLCTIFLTLRHTMTLSYRNVREISRAFILKVSNELDLCYNIRDIFFCTIFLHSNKK